MATHEITGVAGQTIAREQLLAFLNIGTAAEPSWAIIGTRVEDSSMEFDWQSETKKDIVGKTWGKLKKPVVTQSFEPCELDAGETALTHLWKIGIVDQNAQALSAQDCLIVHQYGDFAERYESCMIEISSLGGEGGGDIGMPINITYGGTRTKGTATMTGGVPTFTPDSK